MNQERFDRLARSLATSRISRGRMLKMGATAALGSVLGGGRLLWSSGPSRGMPLDSPELGCDFHIDARPAREAEVTLLSPGAATETKNAGGFGRCADPPGTRIYLDGLLDLPMPAVGEEQRIAIFLEEDILRLNLRNGAEANPPLGPDETTVALARRQAWDKRITWTAPQSQSVWGTRSIECTNYSAPMRLRDPWYSRQYTIVFEKPKFLGQWTSMYHWYPPQFMSFFGGKITSYCWSVDNWNNPVDPPAGRSFRTSFENYYCERMPDWRNSLDPSERIHNVDGPPYCDVITGSRARVGRTYLRYGGRATPPRDAAHFCYFRVFDLQWPITRDTGLIYYIYPKDDLGRFVGLDLLCTDGIRLRWTDAVDQNGHRMHPMFGHGGDIPLNQWSPIKCHIGRWLAGRTIERILVGFDGRASEGWFSGNIDDIQITDPFEG